MLVWNLVHPVLIQDVPPDEVARRYDLPEAVVLECLEYYQEHRSEIDAEIDDIGRRLGLK
jgi:uncharacterized protein (DUF433 family)